MKYLHVEYGYCDLNGEHLGSWWWNIRNVKGLGNIVVCQDEVSDSIDKHPANRIYSHNYRHSKRKKTHGLAQKQQSVQSGRRIPQSSSTASRQKNIPVRAAGEAAPCCSAHFPAEYLPFPPSMASYT